jgi:plastocyanin
VRTLATLLAVALLAGCGTGSTQQNTACTYDGASDITQILLEYYTFVPRCFRVTTGTSVTFINLDQVPHTVTTDAGQVETFDSGSVVPGGTYTHVFAADGDIALHCSLFPIMTATAYVRTP